MAEGRNASFGRYGWCRIPVAAALVLLAACGTSRGDDNIRAEMREVAFGIRGHLEDLGDSAVEIDEFGFQGSESKLKAAAGAGLVRILTEELQKQKVAVKRGAAFRIRGSYMDVLDAKSRLLAAQFRAELVDPEGRVAANFSRGVFGDAALASLFGVTGDFTAEHDIQRRSRALEKMLDEPSTHVAGETATTAAEAPYAVELLSRAGDGWKPKRPQVVDGQATLAVGDGQEFAVRLINRSPFEAAVFLTVDGLSLFSFSESRTLSQVIIPAKSSAIVSGWHRRGDEWEPFRLGARPAATSKTKTGHVVTAVFSACWKEDAELPTDEPISVRVRRFSRCADPAGTELGLPAEADGTDATALAEIPESPAGGTMKSVDQTAAIAELPDAARPAEESALAEIPDAELTLTNAGTKPYAGSTTPVRELRREFGVVRTAVSVRVAAE